jgi:peptide/nickel transport system substrate-binding protein
MVRKLGLILVALLALGLPLFAGGQGEDEGEEDAARSVERTGMYGEAPMLREMVEAGELPPVDERLPAEPFVVETGTYIPAEDHVVEIGEYGGTLRYATASPNVAAEVFDACREPHLMTPGGKLKATSIEEIEPSFLKSWSISDDQLTMTFELREGVKWSDGVPITTEDIRFAWEDVQLNESITPNLNARFRSGGTRDGDPMELEIVDDYTFRFHVDEPNPGFIEYLGFWGRYWADIMLPAHYLKRFHKDYADPDEYAQLLDEENLSQEEWWRLFTLKNEATLNWTMVTSQLLDFPRIDPWVIESRSTNIVTYTRNPYYFKVDAEGNQLPYIDKLRVEILSDREAVTLKILSGEVDWMREYASMVNLPLYKENEVRGGFNVHILDMHVAPLGIYPNMSYEDDPVWHQVSNDVRFRKALSHAIDSEEVVELVYNGFGRVPELVPAEFDPELANQLLDEAGLNERDGEGMRLGPDGNPFTIELTFQPGWTPEIGDMVDLVTEYWNSVGLRVRGNPISRALLTERMQANQTKMDIVWAHTPWWRAAPTSRDWLPDRSRAWYDWVQSNGAIGTEPPDWVKRAYEIAALADSYTLSAEETEELHEEMLTLIYENVPVILPMDGGKYPLIGNQDLRNIADDGQALICSFYQEQFYFENE